MPTQIYEMDLEDCACPSFCSSCKPFFGTLNEVTEFVAAHEQDETEDGEMPEIVAAFREWRQGKKDVTHIVAYSPTKLLVPTKLLYSEKHTLQHYQWEHSNIWNCIYSMRCSKVETEHRWVKYKDGYMRCVVARFENLEWTETDDEWCRVDESTWGLHHMLCFEGSSVRNRLAEPEKRFDTEQEMETDHQAFLKNPTPDFKEFCNEVFGDG